MRLFDLALQVSNGLNDVALLRFLLDEPFPVGEALLNLSMDDGGGVE